MSDYTIHKDTERKQRYLDRHRKMKTGMIMKVPGSMQQGCYGTSLPLEKV